MARRSSGARTGAPHIHGQQATALPSVAPGAGGGAMGARKKSFTEFVAEKKAEEAAYQAQRRRSSTKGAHGAPHAVAAHGPPSAGATRRPSGTPLHGSAPAAGDAGTHWESADRTKWNQAGGGRPPANMDWRTPSDTDDVAPHAPAHGADGGYGFGHEGDRASASPPPGSGMEPSPPAGSSMKRVGSGIGTRRASFNRLPAEGATLHVVEPLGGTTDTGPYKLDPAATAAAPGGAAGAGGESSAAYAMAVADARQRAMEEVVAASNEEAAAAMRAQEISDRAQEIRARRVSAGGTVTESERGVVVAPVPITSHPRPFDAAATASPSSTGKGGTVPVDASTDKVVVPRSTRKSGDEAVREREAENARLLATLAGAPPETPEAAKAHVSAVTPAHLQATAAPAAAGATPGSGGGGNLPPMQAQGAPAGAAAASAKPAALDTPAPAASAAASPAAAAATGSPQAGATAAVSTPIKVSSSLEAAKSSADASAADSTPPLSAARSDASAPDTPATASKVQVQVNTPPSAVHDVDMSALGGSSGGTDVVVAGGGKINITGPSSGSKGVGKSSKRHSRRHSVAGGGGAGHHRRASSNQSALPTLASLTGKEEPAPKKSPKVVVVPPKGHHKSATAASTDMSARSGPRTPSRQGNGFGSGSVSSSRHQRRRSVATSAPLSESKRVSKKDAAAAEAAEVKALLRRRWRDWYEKGKLRLERERASRERAAMRGEEWSQARASWWGVANAGAGGAHDAGKAGKHSWITSIDAEVPSVWRWREVRVMVIFAGDDLQGERAVLARRVFPALNARFKGRRLRVLPVGDDWGTALKIDDSDGDADVDGAATAGAAGRTVLDDFNGAPPIVVVVHGERVGPLLPRDGDGVATPAFERTVRRAFLDRPHRPVHAMAYRREPFFLELVKGTDPDAVPAFEFDYEKTADGPHVKLVRNTIRRDMDGHPFCTVTPYPANYGGLDANTHTHVATDLDAFESAAFADLQRAIGDEFPPVPAPGNDRDAARVAHNDALMQRIDGFVGRAQEIGEVIDALDKGILKSARIARDAAAAGKPITAESEAKAHHHLGGDDDVCAKPVVLLGESGEGISATTAAFIEAHVAKHAALKKSSRGGATMDAAYLRAMSAAAGGAAAAALEAAAVKADSSSGGGGGADGDDADEVPMPSVRTFYHFVQASADAGDVVLMLARLSAELRQAYHVPDPHALTRRHSKRPHYSKAREEFAEVLAAAGMQALKRTPSARVVLVVDHIERLRDRRAAESQAKGATNAEAQGAGTTDDGGSSAVASKKAKGHKRSPSAVAASAALLDWLPAVCPVGVHIVVSCVGKSPAGVSLQNRVPAPITVNLAPMADADRLALCKAALLEDGWRVSRAQLAPLLDKDHAGWPVFLSAACDEMRRLLRLDAADRPTTLSVALRALPDYLEELRGYALGRAEQAVAMWLQENPAGATYMHQYRKLIAEQGGSGVSGAGDAPKARAKRIRDAEGISDRLDDEHIDAGEALVRDTLLLLLCSRSGLTEHEMAILLSPNPLSSKDNLTAIPTALWRCVRAAVDAHVAEFRRGALPRRKAAFRERAAAKKRSQMRRMHGRRKSVVSTMLDEGGFDASIVLTIRSPHVAAAVKQRYLLGHSGVHRDVHAFRRLAKYHRCRADPQGDGSWLGRDVRNFSDMLFYEARGLGFTGLAQSVGSLRFIQACATMGVGPLKDVLAAVHTARKAMSEARHGTLRTALADAFSNRGAEEKRLTDFAVLVGSNLQALVRYPHLAFQLGVEQPPTSSAREAADAASKQLVKAMSRSIENRETAIEGRCSAEELKDATRKAEQSLTEALARSPRWWLERVSEDQHATAAASALASDFVTATRGKVMSCDVSPAGDVVAAGMSDGSVKFLNTDTGSTVLQAKSTGHKQAVSSVAFSDDSARVLSGSLDGLIISWNTDSGAAASIVSGHMRAVTSVKWLDSHVNSKAAETHTGANKKGPTVVGASVRLRMFVSSGMDFAVIVWRETVPDEGDGGGGAASGGGAAEGKGAEAGAEGDGDNEEGLAMGDELYEALWTRDFLSSPVICLSVSTNFNLVMGSHASGHVSVWSVAAAVRGEASVLEDASKLVTDHSEFMAHEFAPVIAVDVAETAAVAVTGNQLGEVHFWEQNRSHPSDVSRHWHDLPSHPKAHTSSVTGVAMSRDATLAVSVGLDKMTCVWDATCARLLSALPGHTAPVACVRFMPTSKESEAAAAASVVMANGVAPASTRFVTGGHDRSIKLWDAAPILTSMDPEEGEKAVASVRQGIPAPAMIATPAQNVKHAVLETRGEGAHGPESDNLHLTSTLVTRRHREDPKGAWGTHSDRVTAVALAPDCGIVVTGCADRELKVWDTKSAAELFVCMGHKGAISAVCFSVDGRHVCSGDMAGIICVWDRATFDCIATITLEAPTVLASSVLSLTCAVVGAKKGEGGSEPVAGQRGHTVLFSGDGTGRVQAWNPLTGKPWPNQPATGHTGPVTSLTAVVPGDEGRYGGVKSLCVGPDARITPETANEIALALTGLTTQAAFAESLQALALFTGAAEGTLTASGESRAEERLKARLSNEKQAQQAVRLAAAGNPTTAPAKAHAPPVLVSVADNGRVIVWEMKKMAEIYDNDKGAPNQEVYRGIADRHLATAVDPLADRVAFATRLEGMRSARHDAGKALAGDADPLALLKHSEDAHHSIEERQLEIAKAKAKAISAGAGAGGGGGSGGGGDGGGGGASGLLAMKAMSSAVSKSFKLAMKARSRLAIRSMSLDDEKRPPVLAVASITNPGEWHAATLDARTQDTPAVDVRSWGRVPGPSALAPIARGAGAAAAGGDAAAAAMAAVTGGGDPSGVAGGDMAPTEVVDDADRAIEHDRQEAARAIQRVVRGYVTRQHMNMHALFSVSDGGVELLLELQNEAKREERMLEKRRRSGTGKGKKKRKHQKTVLAFQPELVDAPMGKRGGGDVDDDDDADPYGWAATGSTMGASGGMTDTVSRAVKGPADPVSVLATGFSWDGTLLVAGTNVGMVSVLSAARPHLGPLAQFTARSDVTAIAVGPALRPEMWPNADGSGRRAPAAGTGNGSGCVGLMVVGEATGRVTILRLHDAARAAESLAVPQRPAVATFMRAAMASKTPLAPSDFTELKPPELEIEAFDAPVEVELKWPMMATKRVRLLKAARLLRVIDEHDDYAEVTPDIELAERTLPAFGFTLDNGTPFDRDIRPEEKEAEPEQPKAKPKPKPKKVVQSSGYGATASRTTKMSWEIQPAGTPRTEERKGPFVSPDLIERRKMLAARGRKDLMHEARGTLVAADEVAEEERAEGPEAATAEAQARAEALRQQKMNEVVEEEEVDPSERFLRPTSVIAIAGGADSGFHDVLFPGLRTLLRACVDAAQELDAMLVTGGVDLACSHLVGARLADFPSKQIRAMGFAALNTTKGPHRPVQNAETSSALDLERDHSDFWITPGNDGDEVTTMVAALEAFRRHMPAVCVLANGGDAARDAVYHAALVDMPIIVIVGSGRLADEIADVMERGDGRSGDASMGVTGLGYGAASAHKQEQVRTIAEEGRMWAFPVNGDAEDFKLLLRHVLTTELERHRYERDHPDEAAAWDGDGAASEATPLPTE